MSYLKRGFLSMIRKPLKTVILFLVVFILGNLMSGAVSIRNTLKITEDNINQNLKPIATVDIDWDSVYALYDDTGEELEFDFIDENAIQQIGSLDYVEQYDYSFRWPSFSNTLRYYYIDDNIERDHSDEGNQFVLHGVEYHKLLKIEEGEISLKEGRVFTEEEIAEGNNHIIIGSEFAKLNNLTIGSTIELYDNVYESDEENNYAPLVKDTLTYEYEVIGIFETSPLPSAGNNQNSEIQWQREDLENTFFIPNNAAIKQMRTIAELDALDGDQVDNRVFYQPIFKLKEIKMLDDFREEATAFLPEYNVIIDTTESLNNIREPMKSINNIATIVLYAAILVTVLILSLLVTLFLHDRRREIGIYIAMGEMKAKVIGQILIEVLATSLVAMTIALVIGNFLSRNISRNMLVNQTQHNHEEYYNPINEYAPNISYEELIDNYNVSLDSGTILMFYGISTVTIIVSTIVPTLYILRLKPKQILM